MTKTSDKTQSVEGGAYGSQEESNQAQQVMAPHPISTRKEDMATTDPQFDIDAIMKKDLNTLTMDELKLRLAEVEKRGTVKVDVPSKIELKDVGPDDEVEITMPTGPFGDIFKINEVAFGPGKHVVKFRVARQLANMVSDAWKIERERMVSRNNKFSGALLRGEELTRIERYQQIIKED